MKKVTDFLKDIILRNPILLEGVVIAPIVVVGTSLNNALLLSICMLIITLPTVAISATLYKRLGRLLRIPAIFLTAAVFYLLASVLSLKLNTVTFEHFGIYLPIFMVNSVILSGTSHSTERKLTEIIRDTMIGIISFAVVAVIVSFLRELLGSGTVFGSITVFKKKMSGILYPFSGYFIIAFLGAAANFIIAEIKKRGNKQ